MTLYFFRHKMICLTAIGILMPQIILAAAPKAKLAQQSIFTDIALHDGGVLVGRLAGNDSAIVANKEITVRQKTEVVAKIATDKNGQFIVKGLQGGIYQIESEYGVGQFRAWAPETAPPTAHQVAFLVPDNENVIRGQWGFPVYSRLRDTAAGVGPWTWVAIGAAVAGITVGVVALVDSNDSGS